MNKIFILLLLLFTMTFSVFAQNYRIFDGKGNQSDLDKIQTRKKENKTK